MNEREERGKSGRRKERRGGVMGEWEGGRRRMNIKMNDVHSPVRSAAGSRVASPSQQNKLTDGGTNATQQREQRETAAEGQTGRHTPTGGQDHAFLFPPLNFVKVRL